MSHPTALLSPALPSPASRPLRMGRFMLAVSVLVAAAGCDYLGLQPVSQIEARKEAEGRATGGACRQAGRALEDCYTFNPHMSKAAIFSGWREMNDYMLQNNLSEVRPEVAPVLPAGRARTESPGAAGVSAPGQPVVKAPARATLYSAP